ncbi:MAG: DUF637 domain-containing protein [Sulfuricella sp.]
MRRLLALLLILILNAEWIGSAVASIPHFRYSGPAANQGGAIPALGVLSGNFSLDNVLRSGFTAGFTAGLNSIPMFERADGTMQSLNQMANVQTTAGNVVGTFNADTFGQNLLGMAGRGVMTAGVNTAVYGGSFGTAFRNSLVNDLAAVGANAVGLGTRAHTPENVAGHALVGAAAAALSSAFTIQSQACGSWRKSPPWRTVKGV